MSARLLFGITLGFGAVAAAVFLLRPDLDLAFSRLFYLGDNRFLLSENLTYRHFNDWVRPALWVFAGLLLFWALWVKSRQQGCGVRRGRALPCRLSWIIHRG